MLRRQIRDGKRPAVLETGGGKRDFMVKSKHKNSICKGDECMGQALAAYTYIFIFPAVVGSVARLVCRRRKRAYLVTAAFASLTAVLWAAANLLPMHGNELFALLTAQAASASFAAVLTGFVLGVKRRKQISEISGRR